MFPSFFYCHEKWENCGNVCEIPSIDLFSIPHRKINKEKGKKTVEYVWWTKGKEENVEKEKLETVSITIQ